MDRWLPAAQSHRCLAASVGEGKQTGQSNPFPKPLASCLRLRQSPPPRPSQTMGVSQRDVAAESQPASGKEVASSPGPRSQPQVRAGSAHVWLQGLCTHPHFRQLAHTAVVGLNEFWEGAQQDWLSELRAAKAAAHTSLTRYSASLFAPLCPEPLPPSLTWAKF